MKTRYGIPFLFIPVFGVKSAIAGGWNASVELEKVEIGPAGKWSGSLTLVVSKRDISGFWHDMFGDCPDVSFLFQKSTHSWWDPRNMFRGYDRDYEHLTNYLTARSKGDLIDINFTGGRPIEKLVPAILP
jgi:hypothetical protein